MNGKLIPVELLRSSLYGKLRGIRKIESTQPHNLIYRHRAWTGTIGFCFKSPNQQVCIQTSMVLYQKCNLIRTVVFFLYIGTRLTTNFYVIIFENRKCLLPSGLNSSTANLLMLGLWILSFREKMLWQDIVLKS